MNQRFLSLCGVIAPLLFVLMTFLGGALRPGYSHLSETISELFSPGSPNKPLLDALHTTYALLMTLFSIGVLQFVRSSGKAERAGIIGAWLYIAAGLISIATATVFPQDAWGSPSTFAGQMHINLTGVVGLFSMLAMLLLGAWFYRTRVSQGFGIYSWITVAAVIPLTGLFLVNMGTPLMGLTERLTILPGFLWTFILAVWIYSRIGYTNK